MRILFSSNGPHVHTGYGNQTKLMVPRLQALGHDLAVHAWFGLQGGMLAMGDIPLYPGYRDPYGNDVVAAHAQHFKADIVITLIDAWVLTAEYPAPIRWCPWLPVDMFPLSPAVHRQLARAFQPIVYSRFGEQMLRDAGLSPLYVPHGVDTAVFCDGDRAAAREAVGWPADAFVIGMVAANKGYPSRKAFPEQLKAFAHFARRHTDALLYLHTDKTTGSTGLNLQELCELLGIADKVRWPDNYGFIAGYPDDRMAQLYCAMDVLSSASMGEGFGIPVVEAQACGTPVVVGDWTAMSELCLGGWKIPAPGMPVGEYGWIPQEAYTPLAANQYVPMIGHILAAYEDAYNRARDVNHADLATKASVYDADRVAREYWQPALEHIAARMSGAATLETTMERMVEKRVTA